MSLRLRFMVIDMHLLGWVGRRYGCHGGSLVRITIWQKKGYTSGLVYKTTYEWLMYIRIDDTIKSPLT